MERVNKTICAGVLATILATGNVLAQEEGVDGYCQAIQGLAENVMDARQVGVPRDSMDQVADETGELVRDAARMMVQQAYDMARYGRQSERQEVVQEFGRVWGDACYENFR